MLVRDSFAIALAIPDLTLLPDGLVNIDSGEEIRVKILLTPKPMKQVVCLAAIGQWYFCLFDVACTLSHQWQVT